jgi:hypothetical protein
MNRAAEDRLLDLAEAVVDGRAVDWDRVLAETPELAPALARFRQLDTMASIYQRTGAVEHEGAAPQAAASAPLFVWGTLRVLEKLDQGSFGEVYRAWDPSLEREVALKLSHSQPERSESTHRWLDEARRLARVRHPNVLVVHGADIHDGRAGIWADLLKGSTLDEVLEEQGRLGGAEATLVGLDLCRALAAVHHAGLVHGDLKASNVMREGSAESHGANAGRIVLMDFGSAGDSTPDAPGPLAFATPLTSAPEVLRGEPATAASDLYSLGVLLYRLVAGRYPIEATDLATLESRIQSGAHAPLRDRRPDLGLAFIATVERALAADPAKRFASAGEMEQALAAALADETAAKPAAASTRHVYWIGAGLLAALLIIVLWPRPTSHVLPPVGSAPGAVTAPSSAVVAPGGAAAPATPAAQVPTIGLTMLRERDGVREPVVDGGLVRPGDRLSLELESATVTHAYVLNEDDAGAVTVLFPLPDQALINPLAPGRHRLPGRQAGRDLDWIVTSRGGTERFLVLATRGRMPVIEKEIEAFSRASLSASAAPGGDGANAPASGTPASGAATAPGGLRGVTELSPKPPSGRAAAGKLDALAKRLRAVSGEIWIGRVDLHNPGP